MLSRKSVHEMQDFFSIIKIENKSDNTKQKKSPGNKSQSKQKSKIEKAFTIEEKGIKNALKLF
jgi:hypothetical protein